MGTLMHAYTLSVFFPHEKATLAFNSVIIIIIIIMMMMIIMMMIAYVIQYSVFNKIIRDICT